jgi:hypothetical protein
MQVSRSIRKIFLVKHKKIHMLLNMKQMFFKTVTEKYTSLYARGSLARTYKVGKRYRFSQSRPAHVFMGEFNDDGSLNAEDTYSYRSEENGGNRVLICFGEVIKRFVPCFDIRQEIWDYSDNATYISKAEKFTCADFVVIGELPLPELYCGIRPEENDKADFQKKLILPGQFKKKN